MRPNPHMHVNCVKCSRVRRHVSAWRCPRLTGCAVQLARGRSSVDASRFSKFCDRMFLSSPVGDAVARECSLARWASLVVSCRCLSSAGASPCSPPASKRQAT